MLIHWQGPRATRSFGLPRSELPTGEQCRRTVHHPARFLSDTVIKCRMLYSIHLISTIYSESASLDGLRAKAAGSFPVVGDCSVLHAASMNGVKRHAKTPFRAHSHRTSDLCFRMSDQILAWTGSASTSGRRQSYKCPCHSCCPTGRPAQYECMLSACFEWTALSLLLLLLLLQFCGPFSACETGSQNGHGIYLWTQKASRSSLANEAQPSPAPRNTQIWLEFCFLPHVSHMVLLHSILSLSELLVLFQRPVRSSHRKVLFIQTPALCRLQVPSPSCNSHPFFPPPRLPKTHTARAKNASLCAP